MADVSQIKLPNGSVYDLIDEKSGYITAEYIENKTDYEIPVSRVGEIVVGETAIGTDSTNFPTSKAVVDYVDERVVQEMDAIDVGVTSINGKTGSVTLSASDVGAASQSYVDDAIDDLWIPTSTSQLTNDSGFITASDMPTQNISWANYRLNTVGTAWDLYPLGDNATSGSSNTFKISTGFHLHEVGGTTVSSVLHIGDISSKRIGGIRLYDTQYSGTFQLGNSLTTSNLTNNRIWNLPDKTGTVALTSDITDEKLKVDLISSSTIGYLIIGGGSTAKTQYYTNKISISGSNPACLQLGDTQSQGKLWFHNRNTYGVFLQNDTLTSNRTVVLPDADGTIALISDIPTIPTNVSAFTNDSGYLTASDIASVMTYKGTKANYAALPSTGNTTGDVWHLTDTGAEWAWDGSAWQELGTAIDLSGYVPKVVSSADDVSRITVASTGVTLNSSQNDSDYSSSIIVNGEVTISASGRAGTNTLSMNQNTTKIHNLVTPTADKDAANKKYVDDSIGALSIPTKVSDLTNDSGFISSYTETDPVFSASAASGITATDISNWNGKSSTDEKVKQTPLNGTNSYQGLLFSSSGGGSEVTNTVYTTNKIQWNDIGSALALVIYNNDRTKKATIKYNTLWLADSGSNYTGRLYTNTLSETRSYYLPDANGIIALTSDIPQVYSSTNTGGYLTMATLPIYDGTVV